MLVRPLTLSGPRRSAVDGLCVTAHCWAEALSPWEAELGGLASLWSALGWLQGKAQPVCLCVSLCARECASVRMSVCARVSACAHLYGSVHVSASAHMSVCAHVSVHACACLSVCLHVCLFLYMSLCLCACECASVHMSVCARVSVCACVCMCTFLLQMCVRVRVRLCVCARVKGWPPLSVPVRVSVAGSVVTGAAVGIW